MQKKHICITTGGFDNKIIPHRSARTYDIQKKCLLPSTTLSVIKVYHLKSIYAGINYNYYYYAIKYNPEPIAWVWYFFLVCRTLEISYLIGTHRDWAKLPVGRMHRVTGGGRLKMDPNLKSYYYDFFYFFVHSVFLLMWSFSLNNWLSEFWQLLLKKVLENIKIPVKYDDLETGTEKCRIETWPIVDPHSVVTFLVEKAGLHISKGELAQYWNHATAFGQEWARGVSVDTQPVGIYGDSARVFTKFSSVNNVGIFFNLVLWKPQSVRMSRFLLFCIPEHQLWNHKTINTVFLSYYMEPELFAWWVAPTSRPIWSTTSWPPCTACWKTTSKV